MGDYSEIKQSNTTISRITGRLGTEIVSYIKNGIAFYWLSFFILILFEFYLGGQLSVLLSGANYATYINILNTVPFYNVLANIGISYAIVYIISYNRAIGFSLFRQAIRLQAGWYLLLVALHVAIFFISRDAYVQTLMLAIIITYTYVYKMNITSYFLATRAYNNAAVANLLQKSALVAVFLVIRYSANMHAALDNNFSFIYPSIELAVVLLYFIFFARTTYRSLTAPKFNYRKRLVKYGKYAMTNNGLNLLYYSVLALILRLSQLDVHLQIILGLCIIFFRYTVVAIAPIFSTMNPQLTFIKNDNYKVQSMYKRYLIITALLSVIALLLCRYCFSFFIDHFYAASYSDLPGFFNFFAYLVPLLFLNSFNGSVMASLGKIKYTTMVELTCTGLLLLFVAYNFIWPLHSYQLFYYFIVIHLTLKFLMLNFGAYKTIKIE